MNIVVILASGNGSRIKNSKIPKQFIEINNKPIVVHTIERFIYNTNIDKTIVVCHPEWVDYLTNYVNQNIKNDNVYIIEGGKERNDSIANAIKFLNDELNVNGDDVILTHDAVRMFVSDRIINENIEMCKKFGAVTTAIPAVDTIGFVDDNLVKNIPNRKHLFNIQTPQTFKMKIMSKILDLKNVPNTSDLCSLFNGIDIYVVEGENKNYKITFDEDLKSIK